MPTAYLVLAPLKYYAMRDPRLVIDAQHSAILHVVLVGEYAVGTAGVS